MSLPRALISLLAAALIAPACIDDSGQRVASDTTTAPDSATSTGDAATDTAGPDATDPRQPCDSPGTTRCSAEGAALEVCTDGAWRATTCEQGRVCVEIGGAQCLQASGEASCRDLVYCYLGCGFAGGASVDACSLACYLQGTVPAQGQLLGFVGCVDRAGCLEPQPAEDTLACVGDHCGPSLAQCYFPRSGEGACSAILNCREACDDEECSRACGEDATLVSQGVYGVLEICILHACAHATTELEQKTCIAQATGVGGLCNPWVRECLDLFDIGD
ncbi:MAG: hypothetical protein IT385_12325 [Deltaproteobacteria bacterium]|nr:hypothetical protein [Deltaproteobacteria bacterium]